MLQQTTRVCRAEGDTAGVARCHLYEGVVHYENDRFRRAAAFFRDALGIALRLDDQPAIALLHLNLGNCALELGDRATAMSELARALEHFERAGKLAHRKRVVWAMAQMLADDGFVDRAIEALQNVASEMELSGLPVDAALARRDIVEVLVLANRFDRTADLARGVLETLAKAGMFRDAMRALTLLQRAEGRVGIGRHGDHS